MLELDRNQSGRYHHGERKMLTCSGMPCCKLLAVSRFSASVPLYPSLLGRNRRGERNDLSTRDVNLVEKEKSLAELADVTLSVPDVSCEHGVKTINGNLDALQGIAEGQTDIPMKSVYLRSDPHQVSLEKVEAPLDAAS
jgi:copper chaperone CopZ